MEFLNFELDGPFEIRPGKIEDERGYFSEIFRLNEFAKHASGIEFVQDNQSLSVRPGTIRGLHFQTPPAAQGKLVRCLAGRLFDVVVDLRARLADIWPLDFGDPVFGTEQPALDPGRIWPRLLHAGTEFGDQLPLHQLL